MLSEAYLDEIESTWLDASEHDIQQFRELSTKKFFDLAGQHIRDLLTEIRYLQRALVSPLRVWFMTYEIHDENGRVAGPINKITRTHPLEWAANPPENNRQLGWVTFVTFFHEIPADVAERVRELNWCGVEE